MRRYEGLFLFDSAGTLEWSEMEAEVRRLCDRIQAELHACVKFDERKLAYDIKGRKRGTYVLTYFDADPSRIADIERDVELSESVLRALVLRADKVSDERLAELRARPADQPLQPISSEGRRGEGRPRPKPERPPAEKDTAEKEAATTGTAAAELDAEAAAGTESGSADAESEAAPPVASEDRPPSRTPETKPADE